MSVFRAQSHDEGTRQFLARFWTLFRRYEGDKIPIDPSTLKGGQFESELAYEFERSRSGL